MLANKPVLIPDHQTRHRTSVLLSDRGICQLLPEGDPCHDRARILRHLLYSTVCGVLSVWAFKALPSVLLFATTPRRIKGSPESAKRGFLSDCHGADATLTTPLPWLLVAHPRIQHHKTHMCCVWKQPCHSGMVASFPFEDTLVGRCTLIQPHGERIQKKECADGIVPSIPATPALDL